jgi:hypothetical protein
MVFLVKGLFIKQAQIDARKLASDGLGPQTQDLLAILELDPLQSPPLCSVGG